VFEDRPPEAQRVRQATVLLLVVFTIEMFKLLVSRLRVYIDKPARSALNELPSGIVEKETKAPLATDRTRN
jgi:hypothetical protein